MNVAYVRVSTAEQNEDRQVEALKVHGIDKWFVEKDSGANDNREQFKAMMNFCREGDTLYIHDFSRLTRSVKTLLSTIEELDKQGVKLVSLKENLDTNTNNGKLILTIIGALNQFERDVILERQREGIECAKKKGVYKGRKPLDLDKEILDKVREKRMSVSAAARQLGCNRATVYNHL